MASNDDTSQPLNNSTLEETKKQDTSSVKFVPEPYDPSQLCKMVEIDSDMTPHDISLFLKVADEHRKSRTNTQWLQTQDAVHAHISSKNQEVSKEIPILTLDFDEADVNLVMSQITCTREAAIEALKRFYGDIVDAIMYLDRKTPVEQPTEHPWGNSSDYLKEEFQEH